MLDDKDKERTKSNIAQKFDSLCTKSSSKNTFDTENVSKFHESGMSEISIEDEIDCFAFVQNEAKPKKNMICENSIDFIRIAENKG